MSSVGLLVNWAQPRKEFVYLKTGNRNPPRENTDCDEGTYR